MNNTVEGTIHRQDQAEEKIDTNMHRYQRGKKSMNVTKNSKKSGMHSKEQTSKFTD